MDKTNITRILYNSKRVFFNLPNEDDHIQRIIRVSQNFYEPDLLNDIRNRVRANDLALDIGANIGNHTIFLSAICGLKVHSFEPYKYLHSVLLENIRLNRVTHLAKAHCLALSDQSGWAQLDIAPENKLGMTRLKEFASNTLDRANSVKVMPLDNLSITGKIALMKIDVEGMEINVLKGGEKLIKKYRPLIYAEAHSEMRYEELIDFLAPFGYHQGGVFCATPTYLFLPT